MPNAQELESARSSGDANVRLASLGGQAPPRCRQSCCVPDQTAADPQPSLASAFSQAALASMQPLILRRRRGRSQPIAYIATWASNGGYHLTVVLGKIESDPNFPAERVFHDSQFSTGQKIALPG